MVLEFIPGCCLWTPVNGLHLLYHPPISHKDSVFFNSFSPGGWIRKRSFFSQVLAEEPFQSCCPREEHHYCPPLLPPEGYRWAEENRPVCPSSSCLAPAVWLFTAGPWAACLHSLRPLWITSGFTTRINECFLRHSLGNPARLKILRKTPRSLPPQIWDDYKKRELKQKIIMSSFPWS